ncbi:MAG: hypothetical protein IIA61_04310 [Candidatus Marinimicrobia bacterium]|nr:hypothetical protein [Candidatus Neomarinimicrobiota bacterium]
MDENWLYEQFERLAEEMDVTLLEGKGDFIGGFCTINRDKFIVLNKVKPLSQRLRVMATSFRELEIHDRYLIPVLREFIELENDRKSLDLLW